MSDMLVKLYDLPDYAPVLQRQQSEGIEIRRVLAPEKHVVADWVFSHFSARWKSETEVAFSYHPPSCFIAVEAGQLIGFACYDTTARGFFGPTGVSEAARGRGVGTALLLACLYDMRAQGYGYAIIGAAGPKDYYKKAVGAVEIEGSIPGVYRGLLKDPD